MGSQRIPWFAAIRNHGQNGGDSALNLGCLGENGALRWICINSCLEPEMINNIHPSLQPWVVDKFKYLGVLVQLSFSTFIHNNLISLIETLLKKTRHWMNLRINIVIFLPNILCMLSKSPSPIPSKCFKWINSFCPSFIWEPQTQNTSLERQLLQSLVGLAFPNFYLYNLASQLTTMHTWIVPARDNSCTDLEAVVVS